MIPFRWRSIFLLLLLAGAMLAVACTTEDGLLSPDKTPGESSASTLDIEAIVGAVVREALGDIPVGTPVPTPDIEAMVEAVVRETLASATSETTTDIEAIVEAAMRDTLEKLITATSVSTENPQPTVMTTRVAPPATTSGGPTDEPRVTEVPIATPVPVGVAVEVRAQPVPVPVASSSVGVSKFVGAPGGFPIASVLTEAGGLTVTARGSVKVAAEEAYVVVIPERFYGPRGPEPLSSEDRAKVIQNLMEIGIEEGDIEFESGQRYDPEAITVEVDIEDLPEIGDLILDAVDDVIRRTERSGVRFSLSDENCDRALALARQEAVSQAELDSHDLAEALGVVRGDIIGAVEQPLIDFSRGPFSAGNGCGGGQFRPYETLLLPFDAEPEIEVSLQMQITYAPRSDEDGGITVLASGSMTAMADEAYVVVFPQRFGRSGPGPLSAGDRADVIQALAEIGIDEDDIEFESARPYEPVQISIEVEVEDLPEIGDLILDAVEDVVRRSERSGVRYSLSEESCDAALKLGRRDAVARAELDSHDLAEALGVVRGSAVGVVEYLVSSFSYGPSSADRCGGQFQDRYALMPFDAEPKIQVSVLLQITYAPQFDETGGLVAAGNGSMTVAADEAYVVVIPERFHGPSGPEPLSAEDRADVIQSLAAIAIREDDIEFESRQPYEPIQISVEVEVEDLPEIGDLILKSVEDVVRRSELSGVRFSLSEESCDAALALACRDAADRAERAADSLAEALDVVRGGLIGAVEYPVSSFSYGTTQHR